VTGGCGVETSNTVSLTVNPSTVITVQPLDQTICDESDVTFTLIASGSGVITYRWQSNKTGGWLNLLDDAQVIGSTTNTLTILQADTTFKGDYRCIVHSDCGPDITSDEVALNVNWLKVSIGAPSPFVIGTNTDISVSVSAEISFAQDLGYYLVSPDGQKVVELEKSPMEGVPFYICNISSDVSDLIFNNAAGSNLDICAEDDLGNIPLSGSFKPEDAWSDFYGYDPSQGGWTLRISDCYPAWVGEKDPKITHVSISFTDTTAAGDTVTVFYDSSIIDESIINPTSTSCAFTDYQVPMGLQTSCFESCDATAVATASGPLASTVSFEWSISSDFLPSFSTDQTVVLCAGKYYVRVTDSYGCTAVDSVIVTEPDEIVITNTYVKDVACNGGTTGEIMLEFTGGTGVANLSYTHDGGTTWFASGDTIKNLPPAEYFLTIRDITGCEKNTSLTINEPSAIDPGFVITPITCLGDTDGEITSTPSNGTAPYDFAWSTGDNDLGVNTSTITSLGTGIYTVTITDFNGCSLIDNAEILETDLLIINGTVKDKYCVVPNAASLNLNNSLGMITVQPEGGAGGYNYTWTGPAGFTPVNNDTINLLNIGDYDLTVTDFFGCTKDTTMTVNEDDSYDLTSLNITLDDESICWYDSVYIQGSFIGDSVNNVLVQTLDVLNVGSQLSYDVGTDNPFRLRHKIFLETNLQIIRVYNDYCKAEVKNINLTYTPSFALDIIDEIDGNSEDDTLYLKGANQAELTAFVNRLDLAFEWTPIEALETPNVQITKVTPEESAWYQVAVSSDDCADTSSIYLEYIPSITPNGGFSPNGDGINDYWKIKHIEKFKNNVVTIYNRWGGKVFEQKGYDNEDESKRWNGTKNGKELGSGTYYYIIMLNEPGFTNALTGPITIVR